MPNVNLTISHILKHVDAEAADSDPTQTAGIQARAQLVRDSVQSFVGDDRDIVMPVLLTEIHGNIPNGQGRNSLRRAVTSMREEDEHPWLAIHEWVRWGRETPADLETR